MRNAPTKSRRCSRYRGVIPLRDYHTFTFTVKRCAVSSGAYQEGAAEGCFAESHAAVAKHNVIRSEKTIGIRNRYSQRIIVMAAKQRANAQAMPLVRSKISAGRLPSCQAKTAPKR